MLFRSMLTNDELTILFARDGVLLMGSRKTQNEAFANIVKARGLESQDSTDDNPSLTRDGKRLYFSCHTHRAGGSGDLYSAPMTESGFGPPALLNHLATSQDETDPCPTSNGDGLLYSARRPNRNGADIYFVTGLLGDASATEALLLDVSSANAGEGQPVLTVDDLTLFFASDRATSGFQDIFVASRTKVTEPFGPSNSLGPVVNSAATDSPAWVSADGCVLYFTSDRPGGAGKRDLYRTTRGR